MLLRKEKAMGKKITKIEPVKQKQAAEYAALKRVCAYCRVSTGSAECTGKVKHSRCGAEEKSSLNRAKVSMGRPETG